MRRITTTFLVSVTISLFLTACIESSPDVIGDEPDPDPDSQVEPVSAHASPDCAEGRDGPVCERCASGFVLDADGNCVRPELPPICGDGLDLGDDDCACNPGALYCGELCVGADDLVAERLFVDNLPKECASAGKCYGQSFTATINGWITALSFDGVTDGRAALEIYKGTGIGCSGNQLPLMTQWLVESTNGWTRVVLDRPFAVVRGAEYTFKVVSDAGWVHSCALTDVYKGGASVAVADWDTAFRAEFSGCP